MLLRSAVVILKRNNYEYYYQLINGNTDPVTLYLDSLAPTGRHSIRSLLNTAAGILGFEDELEHIPWQMLEYQHLATIRSELMTRGKMANTANLTISAVKECNPSSAP